MSCLWNVCEDTISILQLQLYPWLLKDKSFHKQVERNIFLYWLQNFSEVSACWKFCSVGYWLCGGSDVYRHESLPLNCQYRKIFFYNECNNKKKAKLTAEEKNQKEREFKLKSEAEQKVLADIKEKKRIEIENTKKIEAKAEAEAKARKETEAKA